MVEFRVDDYYVFRDTCSKLVTIRKSDGTESFTIPHNALKDICERFNYLEERAQQNDE